VLRALDALAPNPIGPAVLELAARLGADVPFMAAEYPMALAWSRGERMHPVRALAPKPVVLVIPDFPIGTADAYDWLSQSRGTYVPAGRVVTPEALATWEEIGGIATNDFQPVVAARHPVIAQTVDELRSRDAVIAMLSGSGSTVFGVFDSPPDAAAIVRGTGFTVIPTRTSDRVVRVQVEQ
jgi:4-diphosphocytidyl-2-C-methyl-D-erythritol kinase